MPATLRTCWLQPSVIKSIIHAIAKNWIRSLSPHFSNFKSVCHLIKSEFKLKINKLICTTSKDRTRRHKAIHLVILKTCHSIIPMAFSKLLKTKVSKGWWLRKLRTRSKCFSSLGLIIASNKVHKDKVTQVSLLKRRHHTLTKKCKCKRHHPSQRTGTDYHQIHSNSQDELTILSLCWYRTHKISSKCRCQAWVCLIKSLVMFKGTVQAMIRPQVKQSSENWL